MRRFGRNVFLSAVMAMNLAGCATAQEAPPAPPTPYDAVVGRHLIPESRDEAG